MEDQILKLLGGRSYRPSNVPQLLRQLKLRPNQQQHLQHVLRALEFSGRIKRLEGNRYVGAWDGELVRADARKRSAAQPAPRKEQASAPARSKSPGRPAAPAQRPAERPPAKTSTPRDTAPREGAAPRRPPANDLITGTIRMNKAGKGFLQPDDPALKEIAIPGHATSTAYHQDRVSVRRTPARSGNSDRDQANTGSVVEVLERKRKKLVGTLQQRGRNLFVIPDDPRMPSEVSVPVPRDVGRPAHEGDKVVVELGEWDSPDSTPEGEIIEVLGAPDEEGVDMLSVLRQYDLPLHFDRAVLDEARAFPPVVQPHELEGRVDCRHHMVVTIDPDDAKDFDDAICLKRLSKDQWQLWVHIADVSHYVKPGTALDKEARRRGNSTYLVDRVIPMLPEGLSNELCSLKPDVERLTKAVEFVISNEGRVISTKFFQGVIRSKRRFSYKEVLAVLQRDARDDIERMLHDANDLAQRIRRHRFDAGSLELDFPEMKIRLDEQGRVSKIEKVENDISHQLIEEYMLLANEAVATKLMGHRTPVIYRVHEEPEEMRLQEYRDEVLSHNIPCGNLRERREVQKLLRMLNELPAGEALKIGFLKSLMRARYALEPLGHYGLAKDKYAHFTSPIRRYADLVVHRALFESSHGSTHSLKETAEHISDTERNSAEAERASKDVKLYAFLKAQLDSPEPTVYPAMVIDIRPFGFFVDVGGLAMSGLVPLSTMDDDFYVFDSTRNNLVGRRTRRVIQMGDKVQVQIAKVDSLKKQVDFRIAGSTSEARPRPLRPRATERRGASQSRSAQPRSSGGSGRRPNGPAQSGGEQRKWSRREPPKAGSSNQSRRPKSPNQFSSSGSKRSSSGPTTMLSSSHHSSSSKRRPR